MPDFIRADTKIKPGLIEGLVAHEAYNRIGSAGVPVGDVNTKVASPTGTVSLWTWAIAAEIERAAWSKLRAGSWAFRDCSAHLVQSTTKRKATGKLIAFFRAVRALSACTRHRVFDRRARPWTATELKYPI